MARTRRHITNFSRGLWLSGPKDRIPEGALRRLRGTHAVKTGTLRTRNGSTLVTALDAHSLYRFADVRFQAVGNTLYRNGTALITGLNGDRLAFVRMPPTAGVADELFITGGGLQRTISGGGDVNLWGYPVPSASFVATKNTLLSREIDDFDDHTSWATTAGSLTDETTIVQEGAGGSTHLTLNANLIATVSKSITVNLASYGGGESSPDEDVIRLWLRIDRPRNINYIDLQFSLGNTTFADDTYVRRLVVDESLTESGQFNTQRLGLADFQSVYNNQQRVVDGTLAATPSVTVQVLDTLSTTRLAASDNTWIKLRIPKRTFQRTGTGAETWASVQAVRFVVATNANGQANVYFDQMALEGGYGLQGTYKYKITWLSSALGVRSNPATTIATVENVERQSVTLTGLPAAGPSDTNVDKLEIWRTVGNGTRYFKLTEINAGTTSFTDTYADYAGLNSSASANVMSSTELPLDNTPPSATYNDAWGPWEGRMWWARDTATGKGGRVYHSPSGRAEVVEGFIDVTDPDDATQKGIIWDGRNWVFTESKLFQILGSGPFIHREVFGVPGTIAPFTVVATPYGIIYQAADGVRLFNGTAAELLLPDAINVLFRGESVEDIPAFEGVVAAFAHNEYFISDGVTTLVANLKDGTWRDLGIGCDALFYEPDTKLMLASFGSRVHVLEAEGALTDSGTAIPFEVEIALPHSGPEPVLLERIYIDANPANQNLAVEVIVDDVVTEVSRLVGSVRDIFSIDVGLSGHRHGVRISGDVSAPVEIVQMWVELDIPEAS